VSEILEVLLSDPKILISLGVSVPLGFAVGSYAGLMAGLVSFGVSFVAVLTLLFVRAWSKKP
jgi:hypothetical protein